MSPESVTVQVTNDSGLYDEVDKRRHTPGA